MDKKEYLDKRAVNFVDISVLWICLSNRMENVL